MSVIDDFSYAYQADLANIAAKVDVNAPLSPFASSMAP
jgi:hypothetical protein